MPRSVAPVTTQATTSPSTTTPVGQNLLGVVGRDARRPCSAHPEERFAAGLGETTGRGDAREPCGRVRRVVGADRRRPPPAVVVSPDGFAFVDGAARSIDLSSFLLGADGKVADLVECASVAGRPSDVQPADQRRRARSDRVRSSARSAIVTFPRLGEVRLLATLSFGW